MAQTGVQVQARVDGDLRPLERRVLRLMRFPFRDVHAEMGNALRNLTLDRFKGQRGPDGAAWEKSKAAQKARRKTLQKSRVLHNSIHVNADDDGFEVGTDVVYAAIHQFGGETGRRGARFEMVARPYMGITADGELADEDRTVLERILEHHVEEALR
jgi:phage virion morphogenesis protein